jgi:2-methylcitrate dehydratase PrpD
MHVDGTWHALGAAAACAFIAGGDRKAKLEAVRIAACQIPFSLYLPLAQGLTGRNSYAAHAAWLGILAASAALGGSTAPSNALSEARRLALFTGQDPNWTPTGPWLITEAYIKPFAGVRHAHYAAAAAIAARNTDFDTASITRLRLATYGEALRYAANRAPQTPIAAQFSLSFAVAAGLRFGDLAPEAYRALDDAELVRLEALVELGEAVEFTTAGKRAARLTVQRGDRVAHFVVDSVPGDPASPLGDRDVEAKFRHLAGYLPEAGVLADAILRGDAARMLV